MFMLDPFLLACFKENECHILDVLGLLFLMMYSIQNSGTFVLQSDEAVTAMLLKP